MFVLPSSVRNVSPVVYAIWDPSGDQYGMLPPGITRVKSEPSGAKVKIASSTEPSAIRSPAGDHARCMRSTCPSSVDSLNTISWASLPSASITHTWWL